MRTAGRFHRVRQSRENINKLAWRYRKVAIRSITDKKYSTIFVRISYELYHSYGSVDRYDVIRFISRNGYDAICSLLSKCAYIVDSKYNSN